MAGEKMDLISVNPRNCGALRADERTQERVRRVGAEFRAKQGLGSGAVVASPKDIEIGSTNCALENANGRVIANRYDGIDLPDRASVF